uniref:Binding-protein-dependent transporter inner membrane protein (ABC.PE.P) n=1 Tax=uncultured marine thaumarchaeote KM3_99_A02 TaxID=1456353 RepID=A0A075I5R2_9ARCH|nr:binding-protein-dependent transporter inner membrane protein (ABC.PE.P) [uncultured marine thaumarchaeote KM3_99_A02]
MGLKRYIATRGLTMFGVLLVTLLLTISLVGSNMDIILKQGIVYQVRTEITENTAIAASFSSVEEFEKYVQEQIDKRTKALGLDTPWYSPQRMGFAMYKLLILDFGHATFLTSDSGSSNVSDILLEKIPRTVLLFTTATIIISIIGIFLGALSGSKVGSVTDRITSMFAVISSSFPVWWVGMLMIFYLHLRISFPCKSNTDFTIYRSRLHRCFTVSYDFATDYNRVDWVWFMGVSSTKFYGWNNAGRFYHCKKNYWYR